MKPVGLIQKRQPSTLAVIGIALAAFALILVLGMMFTAVLDAWLE